MTENGDDDDGEVEHVPRLAEVVPAQADQLHEALEREESTTRAWRRRWRQSWCSAARRWDAAARRSDVETLRLVVVLDRHRRHVQQDHQHYADVELLVRRQLEEEQLTLQLQKRTFKLGTESEYQHALANISRSRYVAIATQPMHRLQIRPTMHN